MKMQNAVVLIGFRGAGKTSLGKLLAQNLSREFIDTDFLLEQKFSLPIHEVFQNLGEEKFREEEYRLLEKFDISSAILVLGAGFVDYEPSFRLLKKMSATIIYLEGGTKAIWRRLQQNPERLRNKNLENFSDFETLYLRRKPFYEELADFTVQNETMQQENALRQLKEICQQDAEQDIRKNLGQGNDS